MPFYNKFATVSVVNRVDSEQGLTFPLYVAQVGGINATSVAVINGQVTILAAGGGISAYRLHSCSLDATAGNPVYLITGTQPRIVMAAPGTLSLDGLIVEGPVIVQGAVATGTFNLNYDIMPFRPSMP